MDRKLAVVQKIAKQKSIDGEITESKAKGKRFTIVYNNKKINFGSWEYTGKGTFIDHKDEKLRDAWMARHEKILLKSGEPAYKDKKSPYYKDKNFITRATLSEIQKQKMIKVVEDILMGKKSSDNSEVGKKESNTSNILKKNISSLKKQAEKEGISISELLKMIKSE